jgi:hypothetical protein
MRLPMGRRAGDFVRAVRPARGEPAAPTGYERQDDRTFYGVLPSTRVTFAVEFYNDFAVGGDTAQVFQASIVVRGRAGSEVDRRAAVYRCAGAGRGTAAGLNAAERRATAWRERSAVGAHLTDNNSVGAGRGKIMP